MKKSIFTTLALASMLAMTACGNKPVESEATSSDVINVHESDVAVTTVYEEVTTTTAPTPVEPVIVSDDKIVPDCPVNVSEDIPLHEFYVQKESDEIADTLLSLDESVTWKDYFTEHPEHYYNRFDVTDCYVKDILDSNRGQLRRTGQNSKDLKNEYDFMFKADYFDGIHIEAYVNGEFADEAKTADLREMPVRGVANTRDNFDNGAKISGYDKKMVGFYSGIQIDMERKEIEAILGEGHLGAHPDYNVVMYNNGKATMVIHYEPEKAYVVSDGEDVLEYAHVIYLISNE